MVVDDDPSIRYLLSRILTDEGYGVVSAASSDEGLTAAASNEIDLVLLDLNLAGMSGQAMLKKLKGTHPALPVVIITAFPVRDAQRELAGSAAFFQKPLDFALLLETIKNLLTQAPARNQTDVVARKD